MVIRLLALCVTLIATPLIAQELTPDEEFDVRLELVLDPRETLLLEGEMVLATIRGFYRETITNEELKLRRMTDFDWIQLSPDKWTEQPIDGRRTVVFERRIAIFPKRPGDLTILPIAHELELMNRAQQRQLSLVRSEPVTLKVTPKPEGAGSDWLPVKEIEISDTWSADPRVLKDGDNVERRIVLRALGVPPELLPKQPPLREPWLITFAPPEERTVQLTPQGPVSSAVWVWYLRPITGEPGVIPSVSIPYFDTSDRSAKSIVVPSSPIGYASFANNASSDWQGGFRLDAKLWGGFLVGLVIAAFAGLVGKSFSTGALRRLQTAFARRRKVNQLRQSERQGDIETFRGTMTDYLTAETSLDEAQRLEVTKKIDAQIFANQPIDSGQAMASARKKLKTLPTL